MAATDIFNANRDISAPAGSFAASLPDAHNLIAVLSGANGMDLDDAREAVISKLKAKTIVEGVTSGVCVQWQSPDSTL